MDPGPLPVQVRTLIVLVSAALNAGTDPLAAVRTVVRLAPSPEVVAAVVRLVDTVHTPGMPAGVVLARIEGLHGT
ncbi:hypothetical protein ACWELJ_25815 [Nocardia sp. NPDC004582]